MRDVSLKQSLCRNVSLHTVAHHLTIWTQALHQHIDHPIG